MATGAEAVAAKAISDVGDHIARQKRLTKDSLVKLLRKAEDAFPALGQSSKLKASIQPLSDSLVQHKLFQHGDKDVRLLVASCFCQVIRVLAPDPPYSHEILRDIFKLIISTFRDLVDTTSPYFIRRVKILETVAKLKCCVLMLDIGCTDLVLEMFNVFFSVIRENHQHSQIQAMLSIMILILEEEVSLPLLDVIFRNLLREKVATSASFKLAVSVIENASEKLEPFVQGYLTSAILDRDSIQSELKELHHDVIYEIFQCAPQMLNAVIPNLTHELLTDQVDVRIKAVNLLGKLFAVPGCRMAHEYRQLFVEFLKRLSDKSPEVRICALQSVKAYCISNPSGTTSIEILAALEERLLDLDDKVRAQAVSAVCEIAKSKLKCIPSKLILRATERLRDKKVSVRTNTLQKLLELYRSYCTQCSEGLMTIDDCLEQIPCRILMLCYDKDCKDFRPQRMELLLAEDFFPILLPVEETLRHWTFLFSVFTPAHLKALNSILTQKRRLQMEMLVYLGLRQKEKEIGSEELQIEMQSSLMKMSRSFVDPSKAEECFHKLHKMKDNSIFKDLTRLLDGEIDFFTSHNIRKVFLKRIGDKHPLYEFLGILSAKCSYNIFCSKHVHSIVLGLTKRDNLNKNLEAASVDLLQDIVSSFPSLLRGCEQQLLMLLSEMDSPYIDKLLQMLGKAGSHLTIELSDFYPSLERLCLDGTRLQSKYAVSVIASLSDSSDHWAFSNLYRKLVNSLQDSENIPTVLQALGCILQYSISVSESQRKLITSVAEKILHDDVESFDDSPPVDEDFGGSAACKLKIFGLKMLVKSILPHQGTCSTRQITDVLELLLKILSESETSCNSIISDTDRAQMRLAASKSVLRLARKWDMHISPQLFILAMLKAKDPSPYVRRLFIDKIHDLLMKHSIPSRYACAFALAVSDSRKDLKANALKFLAEFVREYSKGAQIHQDYLTRDQGAKMMSYPEYTVVFLIHILAHESDFHSKCQDEKFYASLCRPLYAILQALATASVDGDRNVGNHSLSHVLNIFHAIRKAEDAIDSKATHKLHALAEIGVVIAKAINQNSVSPSHTLGMVLLPSAFYKAGVDGRSNETDLSSTIECSFDANFFEKVLHFLESYFSQATISSSRHRRKVQEDSQHVNFANNSLIKIPVQGKVDKTTSRKKVKNEKSHLQIKEFQSMACQVNSKSVNKQRASLIDTESKGVLSEISVDDAPESIANNCTDPNLVSTQRLPHSRSLMRRSSSSTTQVSVQGVDLVPCTSLEEIKKKKAKDSGVDKRCKYSNFNHPNTNCNMEVVKDMHDKLPGEQIKLCNPVNECFRLSDEFKCESSSSEEAGEFQLKHSDGGMETSDSGLDDTGHLNDRSYQESTTIRSRKIAAVGAGKRKRKDQEELVSAGSEVISAHNSMALRTRTRRKIGVDY